MPFQRERFELLLALRRYGPLGFLKKIMKSFDARRNLRDSFRLSDLVLLEVITGPFIWNLRGKSNLFSHLLTLILLMWRIWWAPNNASRWQMGFNSAFKGLNILYIYNRAWYIGTDLREKFLEHLQIRKNYWNLTIINIIENFSNLKKSLNLVSTNSQEKKLRAYFL